MISIITHGRNDDWQGVDWLGNTYLDSVYKSISSNLKIIDKLDVEYEYILVEWAPFNDLIMDCQPRFKELFAKYPNLRTIVVDKSVVIKEGYKEKQYFEYFAKNVGMRDCKYENTILVNTDIIIYPQTMKKFIEIAKNGIDDSKIYRIIWRYHGGGPPPQEQTGKINNKTENRIIGGNFPGDIHMTSKSGFEKYGKGYDEGNDDHKTLAHTGMDSELIRNWYENGGEEVWLEESYWHINHHHPNPYDPGFSKEKSYKNRSDWGYIKYLRNIINEQLTIIKA